MQLKLEKLQGIVKDEMRKEKSAHQLIREAINIFGPAIEVSSDPRKVFAAINDELTVMESKGLDLPVGEIKVSTLLAAANTHKEAKKIAARLLPERYAIKFLGDRDSSVRCAAAKRFSSEQLKEAVRRFPMDDQLATIARQKMLSEAGIPTPKISDEEFDIYGDGPLGEVMDGFQPDDLTDGWYKRTAKKMFDDYKGRFDGNWKNLAISRLCSSVYATSGVKIDSLKLHKELEDIIDSDGVIKEGYLKSLKSELLIESTEEETAMLPILEESFFIDPVKDLLRENTTNASFISAAETFFNIEQELIDESVSEPNDLSEVEIPKQGILPEGVSWDAQTEQALDRYVTSWNKRSASRGSNCKIVWNHGFDKEINFSLVDR